MSGKNSSESILQFLKSGPLALQNVLFQLKIYGVRLKW